MHYRSEQGSHPSRLGNPQQMWVHSECAPMPLRDREYNCCSQIGSKGAIPALGAAPKLALGVELLPWERWLPLSNCAPAVASRSATSSPSEVRGSRSSGANPFRPILTQSLLHGDVLHAGTKILPEDHTRAV